MIESASRRYRTYAWDAQRHVYCDAVLGTAPQHARGRVPSQERAVHVTSDLLPVVVEAIPMLPSMDLGGIITPIEDGGLYLSGMVVPVEDGGI
jgi:hypothetical protein